MDVIEYQPKLLSLLSTKADLFSLEEKLDTLTSLLSKIDTNYEAQIKKVLDYISFNAFTQDFQSLNLNLNSQADLENYLNLIKENIQNYKFLKLTLAITPTKEFAETVAYWINKNLGQMVLVDLNLDKSIIAGELIEFEGKYKDYSLKSKLEKYFDTNHPAFT